MNDVKIGPNDILRLVLELFAFVSLGIWGFATWPVPVNIVFGIVAPALAILLWALFRSPKAVIHLDPFGRALVEIVVFGSAAFAWWNIGAPLVGVVFGVVAVVSGVIAGRKEYA